MKIIKRIISGIILLFMIYVIFLVIICINQFTYIYRNNTLVLFIVGYCVAATILLIMRISAVYSEKELRKYIKLYWLVLFVMYLLLVIDVRHSRLFNYPINREFSSYVINLIPFSSPRIIKYTIYNLGVFAPLGFFLPVFFKKLQKFNRFIVVLFIVSIISEAIQPLSYGYFIIDDIILQIIGGITVFFIFKIPAIQKFLTGLNII
jgi:VanZ like family.